jgi:DNA modification methylase
MLKTKSIILRAEEEFYSKILAKSALFYTDKSKLIRESVLGYWPDCRYNPEKIYQTYVDNPGSRTILIDTLVSFLRIHGYPFNRLSKKNLAKEMDKLSNTKCPLLSDGLLQNNTVGVLIANNFHKHMIKVQTDKYRTPYEQYADNELLTDAIKRLFELKQKPSFSNIRRILRTRDGVKSVVNFKPSIAKYIYDTYCPCNGTVLDPCAGFGGRLAGCISSNRGISYCGIEPVAQTFVGNAKMASFFSSLYTDSQRVWSFDYSGHLGCAEEWMPKLGSESFDMIFTSPPFFNKEKYSTSPNQSYIRYPKYDEWKNNFLKVVISESFRLIKRNGYLILNLKNYINRPIGDDAVSLSKDLGFNLIKTYKMKLSNLEYGLNKEQKWHTEPIYVWQKQP